MTKKILAVAMAALLMLSVFAIGACATDAVDGASAPTTTAAVVVETPKELKVPHAADPTPITKEEADAIAAEVYANLSDFSAYISYGSPKDNDGLSAETPKPGLGNAGDGNTTDLFIQNDGGNLIVCGKFYMGVSLYEYPAFGKTFRITSNDGENVYKNPEPDTNPSCAMKMKSGSILKFASDTVIEDIILFNEHDGQTATLAITNNSTLILGENIDSMKNVNGKNKETGDPYTLPCHISLYVEEGSTLIVKSGTYDIITGGGNVYIEEDVVVEDLVKAVRWNDDGTMHIEAAPIPTFTLPAVTEEAAPATTAAAVVDGGETASAPVALIIGIVAAVVVVAVVVVVIVSKKKK